MSTRLVPQISGGMPCPTNIKYSKIVGTSPAIAEIIYDSDDLTGYTMPNFGDDIMIQIDNSIYYGFLFRKEEVMSNETGDTEVKLELVNWIDRLNDYYIFGAFNVTEQDGRTWHLLPKMWDTQERIYVTRELEQYDFSTVQNIPDDPTSAGISVVAKKNLLSSATILNMICDKASTFLGYPVTWSALNASVINILKISKPLNIDWQDGVTLLEALGQLLAKTNMTFVAGPFGTLNIVLKGFPDYLFFQDFLNGLVTMCPLEGVESSRGQEVNEEGRAVLLIGERNKYQYVMPCRPGWNYTKWNFGFCYDRFHLKAVLEDLNLTPFHKLKDMPIEYHDDANWSENDDGFGKGAWSTKSTRNEMSINEYIDKICFHSYVVDCACFLDDFQMIADYKDEGTGKYNFTATFPPSTVYDVGAYGDLNRYNLMPSGHIYNDTTKKWSNMKSLYTYPWNTIDPSLFKNYESLWPVSQKLVTDSNVRAIAFCANRNLVPGEEYIVSEQMFFVPTKDFNLDIEEKIDDTTNKTIYVLRAMFGGIKYILTELEKAKDPYYYEPDHILVMISFDREIYTFSKGDMSGIKPRMKKHTIKNLHRAFVTGLEKFILAENFQQNLRKAGVPTPVTPVLAPYIANKIADMLLFHLAVTSTGMITFEDMAGQECDGIIESVNVSFNDESGVTEVVNFSNSVDYNKEILSPYVLRVSKPLKTDSVLNRERLQEIASMVGGTLGKLNQGFDISNPLNDAQGRDTFEHLFQGHRSGDHNQNSNVIDVIIDEIGGIVGALKLNDSDVVIGE